MLFKNAMKAASAAALWMVALLGANSAMAQTTLSFTDATTGMTPVFSAEILAGTGSAYPVTVSGGLEIGGAAFGTLTSVINKSNAVYIRLDAGGVLKLVAAAAPGLGVGAAGSETAVEAADVSLDAKGNYVIYTIDMDADRTGAHVAAVTFGAGSIQVTGVGTGTVRLRAYDDIRDAIDGDAALTGFDYRRAALTVARSFSVMAAKAMQTATVVSGFTQFSGAAGGKSLGGLKIHVACHFDPTSGDRVGATACDPAADPPTFPLLTDVNIDTAVNRSGIVVSGDGGFGFAPKASQLGLFPGSMAAGNTPANPCGGTRMAVAFTKKMADGMDDPSGPVSGALAVGTLNLCATVSTNPPNTVRIPEGDYMATVTAAAAAAGRPFPPQGAMDLMIGTIEHDGTTVNIPYLTSHMGYTQRIVITNRNKQDVSYMLTFQTEGDGTADPMYIEGMAMGEMNTVIKVAEHVTFMNPTRASGTLDIVSTPTMVDVATTMVNKMDESTDTVVLHLGQRDANM